MEWLHTQSQRQDVQALLEAQGLSYETNVDETALLYDEAGLLATASMASNVIKMVAVRQGEEGQDHMAKVLTAVIKRLSEANHTHTFLYTRPGQESYFKPYGYQTILATHTVAFMERGGSIRRFLSEQATRLPKASNVGCIVINANPLTLGHAHLIDTLAAHHDLGLIFVVAEDHSVFPYALRDHLVRAYAERYPHLVVLSTGPYLVSKASFPSYFLNEDTLHATAHASLDVALYQQFFRPYFNLQARYVGEEPFSPTTDHYNRVMKDALNEHLKILPRKTHHHEPISASKVRALLRDDRLDEACALVPDVVAQYLKSPEGADLRETLKRRHDRHS